MIGRYLYPYSIDDIGLAQRLDVALTAILLMLAVQAVLAPLFGKKFGVRPPLEAAADIILRPLIMKLNRKIRSDKALFIRGGVVCFVAVFLTYVMITISKFLQIHDVMMIAFMLVSVSPLAPLYAAYQYIRSKGTDKDVLRILSRAGYANLIHHDDHGLNRHVIKIMMMALNQYVVIPVIIFLIFREWGLLLFVFFNMIKNVAGRAGYGGMFAAIPKLFLWPVYFVGQFATALLVFIACIFAGEGHIFKNMMALPRALMIKPAHVFEGGLAVSIVALAMGKTLGGPYQDQYGDGVAAKWVGGANASAQVERSDVMRALHIFVIAYLAAPFVLFGAILMF